VFDSVFSELLEPRFPDDRPLIPLERINSALDSIEDAAAQRMREILEDQTRRLIEAAAPALQRRDAAAIAALDWDAAAQLQAPIFSTWSLGWRLGSQHMLEEMAAAVPREERFAQFAPADREAIATLLKAQPGEIANTGAELAVLRRTVQLAGSFSKDQLGGLKLSLIKAITPDQSGNTLSRKDLLAEIQTNLKVGSRRAEMIARTELTNAYNTSRLETALGSPLVTHLRFLAISDDRTTPICSSRNGLLFPTSDQEAIAANKPPLHVQCRSTLSPVMAGVNPLHRRWADDPDRRIENRNDIAPLPKGWRQGGLPKIPIAPEKPSEAKPKQPTPRSHTDLIKSGKKTFKDTEKQIKASSAEIDKEIKTLSKSVDKVAAKVEALTAAGKPVPSELIDQYAEGATRLDELKARSAGVREKAMREFLNGLKSGGLPPEDAIRRADAIAFDRDINAYRQAEVRNATTELFQISGGKGSASLKRFVRESDRAWANPDGRINIGYADRSTIFHEIGHHIEFESKELENAARDFVLSRAEGAPRKLRELTGNERYEDWEEAYPDKFVNPYVGKIYENGSTEVLSMGVEHLVSVRQALRLYDADPEHFYFTVGALR